MLWLPTLRLPAKKIRLLSQNAAIRAGYVMAMEA
jgi:hypothetical protein